MNAPISLRDIRAAAERLQGVATRTQVLENPDVNERLSGRLLLKCENLQRSGAFKLREAYARMSQMSAEDLARGVVARIVAETGRIEVPTGGHPQESGDG